MSCNVSFRGPDKGWASFPLAAPILWALFAITLAAPTPVHAVDAFYERLLTEGKALYESGEFPQAARKLELACFGMLEAPESLTQCQIYLTMAHGAAGDEARFKQAFERLMNLEEKFSTLSKAQLTNDWNRQLEEYAKHWVPYETLRRLPGFERAARQRKEATLMTLPVPERKEQLDRLLEQEPNALAWRILRAEVDLETGEYQSAVDETFEVLQEDSERIKAICVRGQALAALGNCEEALRYLYPCGVENKEEAIAEAKARCHLQLDQLDEAESTVQALSTSSTKRTLLKDIKKARRAADRQPQEAPPEEATETPIREPETDEPATETGRSGQGSP